MLKYSQEKMFIIVKQYRHTESSVEPLTYYYIMFGNIYECPTLNFVILTKFNTLCNVFIDTFSTLSQFKEKSYIQPYSWNYQNIDAQKKPFSKTCKC